MKKYFYSSFVIFAMVFSFIFSGCIFSGNDDPQKVEGSVWTYYIQADGSAALVGLNPDAIPENGVLYIPNMVDGHQVAGFGVMLGNSA